MTVAEPQHMVALGLLAKAAKRDRAAVKRDLRAGRFTLRQALDHHACQRMALFDLLCVQHGWGAVASRRLLDRAAIGHDRRVGDLTDRQRGQVAAFADARRP